MTTTYLPMHPSYLDEADTRGELTRVFDVCDGCRACVDLCATFPTLFDLLDRLGAGQPQPDAGRLTPADQDRIVDECVQCKSCVAGCPYTPDRHPAAVDVPRLMLLARAMQHAADIGSLRSRWAQQITNRPRVVASLARVLPKTASRIAGADFVRPHFSAWFAKRPPPPPHVARGAVTLMPTCRVEYHEPAIGADLVGVYDVDGIACSLSDVGCCGAPWLYAGDIDRFVRVARRNVATLASETRRGTDIVVIEPSCRHVVQVDYLDHLDGSAAALDAALVAKHTFGPSDHQARLEAERST